MHGGGSVEAHSEGLGRGSEFVIRLPLSARASADVPAAADNASSMLRAHRVLVVDDNRDSAGSVGMLLTLLGVDVQVTFSGQEALDAAATVVLLDIGMAGMDGHEVARRIRRDPALRNVTLIAVTGWGQEEDRRRSRAAGFDHHLIKPADIDTLRTILASLDESALGPRTRERGREG